jgi:hypothetical protein
VCEEQGFTNEILVDPGSLRSVGIGIPLFLMRVFVLIYVNGNFEIKGRKEIILASLTDRVRECPPAWYFASALRTEITEYGR